MYSKLTMKYQTTIPREIRKKLGLKSGDSVFFYVTDEGLVVLKKAQPFDIEYLKGLENTLDEWNCKEDDEAFEHLQSF